MKRELVSLALCELDERYISETETFSPAAARGAPERTVPMKRKRIFTLALAAALILALGVTVYAASGLGMIASHRMPETGEYTDLASLPQIEKTFTPQTKFFFTQMKQSLAAYQGLFATLCAALCAFMLLGYVFSAALLIVKRDSIFPRNEK